MIGLFCDNRKAKNNEEFRIIMRKRQNRMWFLFAAGLLSIAVSLILFVWMGERADDYRTGILLGFGCGLCGGAIWSVFSIRRLLSNEEKLKERRLKEMDERNIEIRIMAYQATARVLLVVLYVLMLVGSFFAEELMAICGLLISFFLISYTLFTRRFEKTL